MRFVVGLLTVVSASGVAAAQTPDTTPHPGRIWLALGSLFLPGLGQYAQGAPLAGGAFSGVALGGLLLYSGSDSSLIEGGALPLDNETRKAFLGAQVFQTAGELSAYDSFRRTTRTLQPFGRYRFLTKHEPVERLLTAPFDPTFLKRWTTWVGLAYTGTVALIDSHDPNRMKRSLTHQDVLFGGMVSLNAGIGEEALFRGWLYPMMYESFHQRFWLANGVQAGIFGTLHPDAGWFAVMIAGWAFYQGWLTRHNAWSVRESIFQHFWYDVVATLVEMGDSRQVTLSFSLPVAF